MSKPLVLLTDDDAATLAAYRRHLRRHFRLITAGSGWEAIDVMQSEMPDVVISDLHMPELNGITLLTEVRRTAPKALRILRLLPPLGSLYTCETLSIDHTFGRQGSKGFGIDCSFKKKALTEGTSEVEENAMLLLAFDSLGDDREIELSCKL